MFTHIALPHLAKVPEEFYSHYIGKGINDIDESLRFNSYYYTNPLYANRLTNYKGKNLPTRVQRQHFLEEAAEDWFKTVLFNDEDTSWFTRVGYAISEGPQIQAPHGDDCRWRLFYLIERGGEDAVTNFWLEKDKPLEREPLVTVDSYDDLMLIEQVKFPLNTWVLFNSRIIHSVENLESRRVSIQISLKNLPSSLEAMRNSCFQPDVDLQSIFRYTARA